MAPDLIQGGDDVLPLHLFELPAGADEESPRISAGRSSGSISSPIDRITARWMAC